MIDKPTLDDLLRADPDDPGCDAGMLILAQYAELESAGHDPATRFPALAAHLRACPACRQDHDSLLDHVRESMPPS